MESQPRQEVNITEVSTIYDVSTEYHSVLKCENFNASIEGIVENDGRITINPGKGWDRGFVFDHSDPDRVIAIANMMRAFAEMVKKENGSVDTNISM